MSKNKITFTAFLAIIFFRSSAFALSLEEYIEQVKSQNLSYAAAMQNIEAYELLREKAKLVTAVTLYGYSEKSFTDQNQALQIFRYNTVYSQKNQVGLSQTADFGLSTNLYYSLNQTTYKGLNTSTAVDPALASNNYQSIPTLEVSLPLWQNLFGSSTKASRDSTYFSNESQKLTAKSLSIQELVDSEKTYWAMVYVRKNVKIQESALESAKQILQYVIKREKMSLGDKSDVLQAKALVETKKLALKQAQNDEKIAARNFNAKRFIDSNEVKDKLEDFNLEKLAKFIVPKVRAADRLDVKADEASMKAAVADAKVEEESNKPELNLYGSYSLNQIERNHVQAFSSSFQSRGNSGKIGVNFSMPINFGLSSDVRRGALKSASAAKITYRQKLFDQENDWLNLVQNLDSYKENLRLAHEIEVAQKSKLENERKRLKQGRTSTYQILLFEQDYSNSQSVTQQTAYKLLEFIADTKLYQAQ